MRKLCLNSLRFILPAALAATFTLTAAAQADDFGKRISQAQQLRAHDRFDDARALYQDVLRDVRKDSSQFRLEAVVLDNLALVEQDRGDYAAAETAFNRGLAALANPRAADPIRIALLTHLAELYIAENRPEDAEPLLRQAVQAVRGSEPPDPMALSVACEDLAVVLIVRHKLDEPEALLREAQALIEETGGDNDPRLTSSLLSYAGLLTAQRKYSEAVEPAERAWQILQSTSTTIPKPYKASALTVLGAVYYHVGRSADAAASARQAVELAEESLGPDHPRLGLYLANYAAILKQGGHRKEAKEAQRRADEILGRNASEANGYTVNVASLR